MPTIGEVMIKALAALIVSLFPLCTEAKEAYDYTNGTYIEIESYDHQYQGEGDVQFYDYESGEYRSGYMDLEPGGSGTIYDYETGDYRDIQLED